VQGVKAERAHAAFAIGLHVVGENRIGQEWDVPEHIMENIRLLQVVDLGRRATKSSRNEPAIGEVAEKDLVRRKPGAAMTDQPVSFVNRSDNSLKSGMPGLDRRRTFSPWRNSGVARPWSMRAWRANKRSHIACSAGV
jgi:hypothetical protein